MTNTLPLATQSTIEWYQITEELQSDYALLLISTLKKTKRTSKGGCIIHSIDDDIYDVALLKENGCFRRSTSLQNYIDYQAYELGFRPFGTFISIINGLRNRLLNLSIALLLAFSFTDRSSYFYERIDYMKKIRSYTSIWSVGKVLYSINDFEPVSHNLYTNDMVVVSLFAVMILGGTTLFPQIGNILITPGFCGFHGLCLTFSNVKSLLVEVYH